MAKRVIKLDLTARSHVQAIMKKLGYSESQIKMQEFVDAVEHDAIPEPDLLEYFAKAFRDVLEGKKAAHEALGLPREPSKIYPTPAAKYKKEIDRAKRAYRLRMEGMTLEQIAEMIAAEPRTIQRWFKKYEFFLSVWARVERDKSLQKPVVDE